LLVVAGACGESPAAVPSVRPPVTVQALEAAEQPLPRTLSAVGTLESPKTTAIAPEIAPEGRRVEAGHVLARLDDAEARAALAVAQARLSNARTRFARQGPLHAQGVASQQALDDAHAELRTAEGAFEEAETRLDKHTVRVPFVGVLGLREVNVGQYVQAGQPLVEVTLSGGLELRFHLPQHALPQVRVGQAVQGVVGRCEARFEGQVAAVDPRIDLATRMVGLRALVTGEPGTLHPGMAVRVRLLVDELPAAIVLPQEAIVRQGTKYVVYTIDSDDTVHPIEVTLGELFVDGVHVESGIEAGARVVVAGQQKLQPGAKVQALPFEPTRNPNVSIGRYGPADCDAL
jgi:membrane fusion protein (multidrug efflux system)